MDFIGLVLTYNQAVLVRDALEVVDPEETKDRVDREYLVAKLDYELDDRVRPDGPETARGGLIGQGPARPIVVTVRDPDASNEHHTFYGDVDIHDIDCGYADLRDPEEFAGWRDAHEDAAKRFEAMNAPYVAEFIRLTIENYAPEGESQ